MPCNADGKLLHSFIHVVESMNNKMIRQQEAIIRNSSHSLVREMRSDDGTNFVATWNKFLQAKEEMDQEEIHTKLNKENIDFNPTAARW